MFGKKLKGPVFLREGKSLEKHIEALNSIYDKVSEEDKEKIDLELRLFNAGLIGEKQIKYELENSYTPMFILHDLYFETEGLSAQIDYIVITECYIYIIECKNMFGNIEINNNGDFMRVMNFNGKKIKEGLYSPITQNMRHLEIIKKMRLDAKNKIVSALIENKFGFLYKPLVVLANPKTILNDRYAKKEIKDMVIRADGLIQYIKDKNKEFKLGKFSYNELEQLANFFLEKHIERDVDVTSKYKVLETVDLPSNDEDDIEVIDVDFGDVSKDTLVKKLKKYRLDKCREEKIKPYFIFNNKQMEQIINLNPKDPNDLVSISGFGEVKIDKYGKDIVNIISG